VKIFLTIFLSLIVVVVCGAAVGYIMNEPAPRIQMEEVIFTVEKGDTVSEIARKLENAGIIKSHYIFTMLSRFRKTENRIKTGNYRIPTHRSTLEIHDLLVMGKQILIKVTIPEGMTSKKVAGYLEEKGITDKESFMESVTSGELLERSGISAESAEGFLFPDTYYFSEDYPAQKVVLHMIETFFKKLEEISPEYGGLSSDQLYEKVILASIIEREYRVAEEAPLIASVFYNRLKDEMALGSCATIEYIITEELNKPHPNFLTYRDLEIESDYNTYIHQGLPPAPISNPGITALNAAFNPAETDFLYFLLQDPDSGKHYFSKTYGEHNKAKLLYLKGSSG